ncbi:MAG: hypothetical protein GC160_28480 [Acidobacteria bacterium]|nr:hypothetical protein [Acidobacteriota bacterium]
MAGCWVALFAWGPSASGQVRPSAAVLAELEQFEAERGRFRRLLPGEEGVTAEKLEAYQQALAEASAAWVARWPRQEFAWRARLEALAGVGRADPTAVREAVDRAEAIAAVPSGLYFPENLSFLEARALLRHGLDLDRVGRLAEDGLQAELQRLDRVEQTRGGDPSGELGERRRRLRWRAALLQADAAEASGDVPSWLAALRELEGAAPPAGRQDRGTAAAYASAQLELHSRRARALRAQGETDAALEEYRTAVRLRPAFGGKLEPPRNQALLAEARSAWLSTGRSAEDWEAWVAVQRGYPIPAMTSVPMTAAAR